MKKKILFIITYLELGGAQKQLLYILKNLDRDKYSLYLYSGDRGYLKSKFCELSDVSIKLDPCLRRNINPFWDILTFFKLLKFIRSNRFDIIHTHSPKASLLGRWAAYFCGIKNIVYTVHGWPFHKFMVWPAYCLFLFLERITAKITKKIVVPSRADLKIGISQKIVPLNKIELIHYGIEVEAFEQVYRQRLDDHKADLIFTISALKTQKGIFDFLKIVKMLLLENPSANFVILGDGPLRNKVIKKIEELKLASKVQLLGWQEDIKPFLKRAKIFVLTSLWEGLPIALIEAVAAGVPVAVTDTGGIKDIVKDGEQGVVVKPADILDIRKGCQKILKNYGEWNRIIKDNREKFDLKHWSSKRMLEQTQSIYDGL